MLCESYVRKTEKKNNKVNWVIMAVMLAFSILSILYWTHLSGIKTIRGIEVYPLTIYPCIISGCIPTGKTHGISKLRINSRNFRFIGKI
jgi:hypothetical protein